MLAKHTTSRVGDPRDLFRGFPGGVLKEDYYTRTAKEKNLNTPDFDQNGVSKGKKISSLNLGEVLGYQFEKEI